MDIQNRKELKQHARQMLSGASYDPKKLILIHNGVTIIVALLLELLDYLLQMQIGNTGGLSGVGLRSVLETAQSLLYIAYMLLLPFWQIGYSYATLRIADRQEARPGHLMEGFHRFGPVLRLRLILGLAYFGLAFASAYIASFLFMFSPWSESLMAAYAAGSEDALLAAVTESTLPMMLIMLPVMLVVILPYYYHMRLADLALMDGAPGALAAIRKSRALMHRNRIALLKLDFSFWWFFLLQLLITFIADGGTILAMFGVELPWSPTVSYYVFLVLCYAAQLLLFLWRGNEVNLTYAAFYRALSTNNEELR